MEIRPTSQNAYWGEVQQSTTVESREAVVHFCATGLLQGLPKEPPAERGKEYRWSEN